MSLSKSISIGLIVFYLNFTLFLSSASLSFPLLPHINKTRLEEINRQIWLNKFAKLLNVTESQLYSSKFRANHSRQRDNFNAEKNIGLHSYMLKTSTEEAIHNESVKNNLNEQTPTITLSSTKGYSDKQETYNKLGWSNKQHFLFATNSGKSCTLQI